MLNNIAKATRSFVILSQNAKATAATYTMSKYTKDKRTSVEALIEDLSGKL